MYKQCRAGDTVFSVGIKRNRENCIVSFSDLEERQCFVIIIVNKMFKASGNITKHETLSLVLKMFFLIMYSRFNSLFKS